MEGKIPISLAIFFLGCLSVASAFEEGKSPDADSDLEPEKRLYDSSKRPYRYTAEFKRLPLYNFGLGKRSPRYNFGLGKRYPEDEDVASEYDEYSFAEDEEPTERNLQAEEDVGAPEKRRRPYSFGPGKRLPKYDFGLGKRTGPYDFGLGKRSRRFNFGLGKRGAVRSFGSGKKAAEPGAFGSRFGFGLGKRGPDPEVDAAPGETGLAAKDAEEAAAGSETNGLGPEQPEEGNYVRDLDKRTKNGGLSGNAFSRKFRKPFSYNFGLGKRRPLYDFGLGKRNFQADYGNPF